MLQFQNLDIEDFLGDYFLYDVDSLAFEKALARYLDALKKARFDSERALVGNVLVPFLESCGLHCKIESGEGNSNVDLSLVNNDRNVVIIEAKKPFSREFFIESKMQDSKGNIESNLQDLSIKNINCKALHEAILYYFRERERGNYPRFIVLTDFYRFYIFRAFVFESYFFDNKFFQDFYHNYKDSKNSLFKDVNTGKIKTKDFYKEAKRILDSKAYLDSIKPKAASLFEMGQNSPALSGLFVDLSVFENVESNVTQNSHFHFSCQSIPTQPPFSKIKTKSENANFGNKNLDSKNIESQKQYLSGNMESNLQDSKRNIESNAQLPTPLAPPNVNIKQGGGNSPTQDFKEKYAQDFNDNKDSKGNMESKNIDSKGNMESKNIDSKGNISQNFMKENIESKTQNFGNKDLDSKEITKSKNLDSKQNISQDFINENKDSQGNIESNSRDFLPTPLAPPNINIRQGGGNSPTQDFKENIESHFQNSINKNLDSKENIESNLQDSINTNQQVSKEITKSKNIDSKENKISKTTKDQKQNTLLQNLTLLFSPDFLYGIPKMPDANELNAPFYNELLHILGLKEISKNGNILIIIDENKKQSFALHIKSKLDNLEPDAQIDVSMNLLILWLNRILFLKLLEANLINFNNIGFAFMTYEKISTFDILNALFFDILGAMPNERGSRNKIFNYLPYLNSSIFTKNNVELRNRMLISNLDSNLKIEYFKDTKVLKDSKKPSGEVKFLEYLFDFLNSYNFARFKGQDKTKLINAAVLGLVFEKLNGYKEGSFYTPCFITSYMCRNSLQKVVIDKFNEKYNLNLRDFTNLKLALKDMMRESGYSPSKKNEFKEILKSIKICDPSVGSGHFLVSALNEMIYVYHTLNLSDLDCSLEVINDELYIENMQGKEFIYKHPQSPNDINHILQKGLFDLKRNIIENNLFGVDINPDSVNICRLRLWIELLKNSYYKKPKPFVESNSKLDLRLIDTADLDYQDLNTLPNIDINIKIGNSLISNVDLNLTKENMLKSLDSRIKKSSLFDATYQSTINEIKNKLLPNIEKYKDLVNLYKNEHDYLIRRKYKEEIDSIKSFMLAIFHKASQQYQSFKDKLLSYIQSYGYCGIDNAKIGDMPLDSNIKASLNEYITNFNYHKSVEIPLNDKGYNQNELLKLIESMNDYERIINDKDSFEWRYEFPEVLDSNGDFKGFDLIVGNPPYISTLDLVRVETARQNKDLYRQRYPNIKGLYDLYIFFVMLGPKIISKNGRFGFIIPNKFLIAQYAEPIYKMLLDKKLLRSCIDVSNVNTFERAAVYPIVILCNHNAEAKYYTIKEQEDLKKNQLIEVNMKNQIWHRFKTFTECGIKFQTGLAGFQAHSIIEFLHERKSKNSIPFAVSGSIDRYTINTNEVRYMKHIFRKPYIVKNKKISSQKWHFWCNEKIIIAGMTKQLEAYYSKEPLAIGVGVYAIYDYANLHPLLLLGILNSKFMNYVFVNMFKDKHLAGGYLAINKNNLEKLPMFDLDSKKSKNLKDKIITLVEKIIESKKKDSISNIEMLESKLDSLIYELYDLTTDEIKIIQTT